MRLKLRTLLILVTLACASVWGGLQWWNYQQAVQVHREAFVRLQDRIHQYDQIIVRFLVEDAETRSQLEAIDPINPELALGRSVQGFSFSVEPFQLTRDYEFTWQPPDGSPRRGVSLSLHAEPEMNSLAPHRIFLNYPQNRWNEEAARRLTRELEDGDHFEFICEPDDGTGDKQANRGPAGNVQ